MLSTFGAPPRLRAEEARRVKAAIVIALALLLPTAGRRLLPAAPLRPAPTCGARPVLEEGGALRCPRPGEVSAPLNAVEGLWVGRRIDLDTAPAEELSVVPGIGPALSARIVADRAERGPFPTVEAVERVKGIGPKLRARLERYVRVEGPSSE